MRKLKEKWTNKRRRLEMTVSVSNVHEFDRVKDNIEKFRRMRGGDRINLFPTEFDGQELTLIVVFYFDEPNTLDSDIFYDIVSQGD